MICAPPKLLQILTSPVIFSVSIVYCKVGAAETEEEKKEQTLRMNITVFRLEVVLVVGRGDLPCRKQFIVTQSHFHGSGESEYLMTSTAIIYPLLGYSCTCNVYTSST